MSFVFKYKGYSVAIARNGMEAIERVKEISFDIVFMDIKMPGINGVETYKKIKEINPNSTVIMMTAYAVENLVQEALKEGAYDVIYKPLDVEKVVTLITRIEKEKQFKHILVVDDSPTVCTTMKNILFRRGYNIDIANTGETAITMVQEWKHDLIFIDMKLPTINGLETYLAIKKINPEVTAIIMTGYYQEMSGLIQQALDNSAYICLLKPLDMDEVLKMINIILEKKKLDK